MSASVGPSPGDAGRAARSRGVRLASVLAVVVLGGVGYGLLSTGDGPGPGPGPTPGPTTTLPTGTAAPGPPVDGGTEIVFDFDAGLQVDAQGRYVTDSTGRRQGRERGTGVVVAIDGDGRGQALKFPPPCDGIAPCATAIIELADDGSFSPGAAPFTYGADLQVSPDDARAGANVVQKGLTSPGSSHWRIELGGEGKPRCVVVSEGSVHKVDSTVTVADGAWHRVTCAKTDDALSIDVDGTGPISAPLPPDVVLDIPTAPLRFGGNAVQQLNNRYSGALDNVSYRPGP